MVRGNGRNDDAIVAALGAIAQAMQNQPNVDENAGNSQSSNLPEGEPSGVQG